MVATIDRDGTLIVSSETPLEAYALRRWGEENEKIPENMMLSFTINGRQDEQPDRLE